jgi:hypothetical protein
MRWKEQANVAPSSDAYPEVILGSAGKVRISINFPGRQLLVSLVHSSAKYLADTPIR